MFILLKDLRSYEILVTDMNLDQQECLIRVDMYSVIEGTAVGPLSSCCGRALLCSWHSYNVTSCGDVGSVSADSLGFM